MTSSYVLIIAATSKLGVGLFAVLLTAFSVWMIINPVQWARYLVSFSQWRWFHPFEILSRLLFGVAFIYAANHTRYPALMLFIGCLLVAVGFGLLLTPPSEHKRFAAWTADKFLPVFRPAGLVSVLFGIFLLYASPGL